MPRSVIANNHFILNSKAKSIIEGYHESSDEEDAGMVTRRQAKQDLIFTKSKNQKDSNQQIIDAFVEKHPEIAVVNRQKLVEESAAGNDMEDSVHAIQKKIKKLKKKLEQIEKEEEKLENADTSLGQENEQRSKKKRILKEISLLKEKLIVKNSQLKRKKNQEFREGKEEEEKGKQLVVKTVVDVEQKPSEDEENTNIALDGMDISDDHDMEKETDNNSESNNEEPETNSNKIKESIGTTLSSSTTSVVDKDVSKLNHTKQPTEKSSKPTSEPSKQQQNSSVPKKKVLVEYVPPYTRKNYTVTIAIPGCILDSNMSDEQKTLICTSIARACTCFKVNEIIIYNEKGDLLDTSNFLPNIEPPVVTEMKEKAKYGESKKKKQKQDDYISLAIDKHVYLANMLYYLETPPYLREKLIPKLKMLKTAMSMPQDILDSAHHLNAMEMSHPYREGLVLEEGNLVYVGHSKLVKLKKAVPPGLRVTVEIYNTLQGYHEGRIVSSETPKQKKGLYWGYNVRLASCFSEVFTQSPYKEGYDMIVTHAEFGKSIDSKDYDMPSFKHLLIVLGGMHIISDAIQNDVNIVKNYNSRNLFDQIINLCPNNGLRSMRIEDVLTLGLGALRKKIDFNLPPAEVPQKDLSNFLVSK
ncbi:hypothetical protein C9374_010059 [Naegleria lovaniensis]|uniref:RNA methyltransferase n=1 Tax=Naegleria lovaniensis TaxID=51637 RepID=A0AA88GGJ0_NAELO|nr:uncharacterized protein C9374_010059 [Naegleria lovaniensis]KAG2375055.1 hypothetical protein C9374_010059 [Naegleria lovaniensis]